MGEIINIIIKSVILYFQAELNVTFSREVLSKIVAYSRSNFSEAADSFPEVFHPPL